VVGGGANVVYAVRTLSSATVTHRKEARTSQLSYPSNTKKRVKRGAGDDLNLRGDNVGRSVSERKGRKNVEIGEDSGAEMSMRGW